MCGISGICTFDNTRVSEMVLRTMNNSLAHRGPDNEGYYYNLEGNLGLGHRRLSIIDLTTGNQPIQNEKGSVIVVFNGEIYNFIELREELRKQGHIFRSNSDTEVIVHLYEEHGIDSIHKLRGMFSIAIWDAKREELYLVRDRIGKKPLYYSLNDNKIFFASEIQALYDVPDIKREIDFVAIDLFLTYSYIPSPYSIYKSIRKLPPAHYLKFCKKSASVVRYWKPEYNNKIKLDYEEAKGELLRILTESIQLRLISDVPLGVFLSGGVDSSTVTAIMSKLSNKPVKTFSIGFSNEDYNELSYARAVSRMYNTEHHEFVVEPDALEIIDDIVQKYGEPYGDSSALPTWYLSRMAKQHVTVALNGDGGDELFGGYPWYQTAHLLHRASKIVRPSIARFLSHAGMHVFPIRVRKVLEVMTKTEAERFQYLRSFLKPRDRNDIYHEKFKKKIHMEAEEYLVKLYDESLFDDYDRSFKSDLLSYLPEDLLVKVDRASMAHALECRSPFLDQELVDFSCSLLPNWKIRNGKTKCILKDAVGNLFPDKFLERPKMGFTVPIAKWFRTGLSSFIKNKVFEGPLARSPLLELESLKNIFTEHVSGKRNNETVIWNVLMLSLWFEKYHPGQINID